MSLKAYSEKAIPHLQNILEKNLSEMEALVSEIVENVQTDRLLFLFGSGHSGILPLEIYHRAGGPSFVIPLVADHLFPLAGPTVVRLMERTVGSANFLLDRTPVRPGEILWLFSQSGINPAGVDLALEAKKRQITTVAFTSLAHSQSVASRHPSGKKLFEVCDRVIDLGGVAGDAVVEVSSTLSVGPISTLTGVFLAHSILCSAMTELENKGIRCAYTSVNTPHGEERNKQLEEKAAVRDPLLR